MTAEELLSRLLDHFDADGGQFVWGYIESTGVADIDPDLARDLDIWYAQRAKSPVQHGSKKHFTTDNG